MFTALRRAASVVLVVAVAASGRVPRTGGPFSDGAYVWQRSWTDPVSAAVTLHGAEFAELVVLAAEIDTRSGAPRAFAADPDWAALARRPRGSVGLAVRAGPWRGTPQIGDAMHRAICDAAVTALAAAAGAGLDVREVQIDFDAGVSQLRGYARWIAAIRARLAPHRVVVTALPSWLGHRGCEDVFRAAHGFVLQVHSLERPRGPDDLGTLCDVRRAEAAVERAAAFGVAFKVALPTYGYETAFSRDGRFLGIAAEGAAPAWPAGADVAELRSEPAEIAALVRRWMLERPETMAGVLWYRLPVEGDRLNWSWPTLRRVRRGEAPAPCLIADVAYPASALAELRLRNAGDADAVVSERLVMRWTDARLLASDATRGFSRTVEAGALVIAPRFDAALRLRPGEERVVAWLRLATPAEVTVHAAE